MRLRDDASPVHATKLEDDRGAYLDILSADPRNAQVGWYSSLCEGSWLVQDSSTLE